MKRWFGLSLFILFSLSPIQSQAKNKAEILAEMTGRAAKLSAKGKMAYVHLKETILGAPKNPRVIASNPADDINLYAFTRNEKGVGGSYKSLNLTENGAANQFDFNAIDSNIYENGVYKSSTLKHDFVSNKVTLVHQFDHKNNPALKMTETQEIVPLKINGKDYRQVASHSVHHKGTNVDKVTAIKITQDGEVLIGVNNNLSNDFWLGRVKLKDGVVPVDMRLSSSGEHVVIVDSSGMQTTYRFSKDSLEKNNGNLKPELRGYEKVGLKGFEATVKHLDPPMPAVNAGRGIQVKEMAQ